MDGSRLLRRNFERRARHNGLTQSQWKALAHLSRREFINQVMLADLMEIQPITLARLIDRHQVVLTVAAEHGISTAVGQATRFVGE